MLLELEEQHETLKNNLLTVEKDKLVEKVKWRFASYIPTQLDVVLFMCINHEAMHLGQLSTRRRAMRLPSELGKIT